MSGGHRVFVIDAERNETESIEEDVARATVNDEIESKRTRERKPFSGDRIKC